MIVIYCAIFAVLLGYGFIKLLILQLLPTTTNNKSSLTSCNSQGGKCQSDIRSQIYSPTVSEYNLYKYISSDETDSSFDDKMDDELPMTAVINKNKRTLSSTVPTVRKSALFKWNEQPSPHKSSYSVFDDSDDSSDEFTYSPSWYPKNKKRKGNHNEIPISKIDMNQKEESPLPQINLQYKYLIAGLTVKIPVKAYPCQMAVMHKVIQGCNKEENCLLESPTGSGKTLALLCGVLAWHDHYTAAIQKQLDAARTQNLPTDTAELFDTNAKGGHESCSGTSVTDIEHYAGESSSSSTAIKKIPHIPKIYYGTRTHKQIEQVVKELRKTDYKHKKMAILSSREHTCIQETTKNKTELCNEMFDPNKRKGCPFYSDSNKKTLSSFSAAESRGLGSIWDIEELVAIGKNEETCPYFAARSLADIADIVFCPYNYIIDPYIRETMQLDLHNQVIILDEAHNIEDICRDVASVNFRYDSLQNAALECEALTKQRASDFDTYNTIKSYIQNLSSFLEITSLEPIPGKLEDQSSPYWTGSELLELFNLHGLCQAAYSDFFVAAKTAIADCNRAKENLRAQKSVKPIISSSTKVVIEQLMFAMRMINSKEHVNDYRACIFQTKVKDFNLVTDDTWYPARGSPRIQNVRMLKLLCMNPGVIFAPLSESARSIILASGTLTPTATFESELRTKFPHVLNAAHVIPKDHVYATCVSSGPNNLPLKATYNCTQTWSFQDELGRVLLDVCESVPHGILCFFSSYSMMNMQLERWQSNNVWNKITRVKKVFTEPRLARQLTSVMTEYRKTIEETSHEPQAGITGALLLAVFRGKVAEGIDFRDNEARCVITVGIPYAVLKDPVVATKVKYNDKNASKNLLSGSDWYTIQAFRALNQALGRCLRHANDWGAVLLVDERFLLSQNERKLPKWVQTMWVKRSVYNLREELRDFVARQKMRDVANKLNT